MGEERRKEEGFNQTLVIFGAVITIILGIFIHSAWAIAFEGLKKGNDNSLDIRTLQANYTAIAKDLGEIKDLLKRKIP